MENKRSLLLQILTKIKYVKNTTPFERIFHCETYFCIFKQIFILLDQSLLFMFRKIWIPSKNLFRNLSFFFDLDNI